MLAGWKSAGEGSTSRVESMGLGGLYLLTANPLSTGSPIELVLELPTGEFHARAIVRRSTPGKGMGVQFIQISPEDRAKLNLFVARQGAPQESRVGALASPKPANLPSSGSQLAISPAGNQGAKDRFERDVMHLVEVTGKGTYYQLLGVTSETPRSQIKKSYYLLARKVHPDSHPGNRELTERLVNLMTVITEAYRTLDDEKKRAAYDNSLAAIGAFDMGRSKTETEESVEDWLARANECINAKNFVGSIVWLCKCVEAAPEQALYHAMLGRSLRTLPQYQNEAIQHFRKAIDLDPWKEPVYVQLAELLEEMRLPESASAVYSKLLEINPTHAGACKRLAALAAERKQEQPSAWISQLFGGKD
jgi:hypothetical protein